MCLSSSDSETRTPLWCRPPRSPSRYPPAPSVPSSPRLFALLSDESSVYLRIRRARRTVQESSHSSKCSSVRCILAFLRRPSGPTGALEKLLYVLFFLFRKQILYSADCWVGLLWDKCLLTLWTASLRSLLASFLFTIIQFLFVAALSSCKLAIYSRKPKNKCQSKMKNKGNFFGRLERHSPGPPAKFSWCHTLLLEWRIQWKFAN